jgi:hypothetical protein
MGGGMKGVGKYGRIRGESEDGPGFDVENDFRQFQAKYFHDANGCRNIWASFEYEGLVCLALERDHSFKEGIDNGNPLANFPNRPELSTHPPG